MAKTQKEMMSEIIDIIIATAKETGKFPWDNGRIFEANNAPMNWERKSLYNGINRLVLGAATRVTGEFLTWNQVKKAPKFRVPAPPSKQGLNVSIRLNGTSAKWKRLARNHVTTTPSAHQFSTETPSGTTASTWNGLWKRPYVKRGSKTKPVIFWRPVPKTLTEIKAEAKEKGIPEAKVDKIKYFCLKEFHVFEVEADTVGIKPRRQAKIEGKHVPRIAEAEKFVEDFATATSLKIEETYGTPCYRPSTHTAFIPPAEAYKTIARFYETEFHELSHSTMKACGREKGASFGSKTYSKEEIVAEVCCMNLLSFFGIAKEPQDLQNSASYVDNWARKLKEPGNYKWLLDGAKEAEKSFSYMLEKAGIKVDGEEVDSDDDSATTNATATQTTSTDTNTAA